MTMTDAHIGSTYIGLHNVNNVHFADDNFGENPTCLHDSGTINSSDDEVRINSHDFMTCRFVDYSNTQTSS